MKLILSYTTQLAIILSEDFNAKDSFDSQSKYSIPQGAEMDSFLDDHSTVIPHIRTIPEVFP